MFDFQQGGMILKKYLPILKNSPFFTGLTDNEILSILHCVKATTVSQKRDSYIFRAGDSTEVMGLVVSGCVLVILEDLWTFSRIISQSVSATTLTFRTAPGLAAYGSPKKSPV